MSAGLPGLAQSRRAARLDECLLLGGTADMFWKCRHFRFCPEAALSPTSASMPLSGDKRTLHGLAQFYVEPPAHSPDPSKVFRL
jgi:hypothetical protein